MNKTKIPWADVAWNPFAGCSPVSQSCLYCYAAKLHNKRHRAWLDGKAVPAQYRLPFSTVQTFADRLDQPLRAREPQAVFVGSMGDLFNLRIPPWFRRAVFSTMVNAPQHTFLALSQRAAWLSAQTVSSKNIWLGVTVEDQWTADKRIPMLLEAPAAHRFVSVEPMLGPTNLQTYLMEIKDSFADCVRREGGIETVICGCGFGPNRRQMNPDWARSLRDQCAEADVPFFLKQMEIGGRVVKMPTLDGVVHDDLGWELHK